MVDEDDARGDAHDEDRLTALALRIPAELTVQSGAGRRSDETDADARAATHAMLFTRLGVLPDEAQQNLFGPDVQRVLYVYYDEGPTLVGAVLDPPVAVHAPSTGGLEAKVRRYVAEHRGVVEADVHPFGKRVDRSDAVEILGALVRTP